MQKKDGKELTTEGEETSKKLFNVTQNPGSLKKCSLLDQPLFQHNVVEMHLDSVFKDKATKLSAEVKDGPCVTVTANQKLDLSYDPNY